MKNTKVKVSATLMVLAGVMTSVMATHAFANTTPDPWTNLRAHMSQASNVSLQVIRKIDGQPITQRQFSLAVAGQDFYAALHGQSPPTNQDVWNLLTDEIVLDQAAKSAGFTVTFKQAQQVADTFHADYLDHLSSMVGALTAEQFQKNLEQALGISDAAYWNSYIVKAEETLLPVAEYQSHWRLDYHESHPKASGAEIQNAWMSYASSLASSDVTQTN